MRVRALQPRNSIDDINGEVKTINLIAYCELERSVDVASLFIFADMIVIVIRPSVSKLMNERWVSVKVEDHGFIWSEKRVEITIGEPMWMFSVGLESIQIHDIHKPNLQIGNTVTKDCNSS